MTSLYEDTNFGEFVANHLTTMHGDWGIKGSSSVVPFSGIWAIKEGVIILAKNDSTNQTIEMGTVDKFCTKNCIPMDSVVLFAKGGKPGCRLERLLLRWLESA